MTDLVGRLTNVERATHYPNRRPKDAATLLVLDRSGREPRVLMGRRHGDHAFLPGLFVFPGGRVDPADSRVPVTRGYDPLVAGKLMTRMKGPKTAARARAFAVAAIREAYEEAGILLGKPGSRSPRGADWTAFAERGLALDLGAIRYIARAITPPKRPRRFDTRFLVVGAEEIAETLPSGTGPSGELEEVAWVSIDEAKTMKLPTITLTVLDELTTRLAEDPNLSPERPVPFYYWRRTGFVRELI